MLTTRGVSARRVVLNALRNGVAPGMDRETASGVLRTTESMVLSFAPAWYGNGSGNLPA